MKKNYIIITLLLTNLLSFSMESINKFSHKVFFSETLLAERHACMQNDKNKLSAKDDAYIQNHKKSQMEKINENNSTLKDALDKEKKSIEKDAGPKKEYLQIKNFFLKKT